MSSTANASGRTAALIVVAVVLTLLGSGALSAWVHNEQESDRRARVEQHRPNGTASLPDPFLDPPRR